MDLDTSRNQSFISHSDVDESSVDSFTSFEEAYDRMNTQIRAGPVFNFHEESLQKMGGFQNVTNYNLHICPTTISKIAVVGFSLIVCVSVPTILVTMENHPPTTAAPIPTSSSIMVTNTTSTTPNTPQCTGICI